MKKINTLLLVLLLLTIFVSPASARKHGRYLEGSYYVHLALTGEGLEFIVNDENRRAFDGLRLPHYIGYLKATQNFAHFEKRDTEELEFVPMTSLPISSIEEDIAEVIRKRYVIDGGGEISTYYRFSDPGFLSILSEVLLNGGVDAFASEFYIDDFSLGNLPQTPKLKAEDFGFINSCVYRPYADPPEECKDLRLARLANEAAVEFKRDAYSDLYWEESVATLRRILKK